MMATTKDHWEEVFSTKAEDEVSWFQEYPKTSVEFFELFNLPLDANIIDIGGGDSHLVDVFIAKGYKNIYVLDISANALERAKQRLGDKVNSVHWIVSDVVDFVPPVKFDFWHDRAAFHFLTTEAEIEKYLSIVKQHISSAGKMVIGTFSTEGPEKCSGLPVKQYDEKALSSLLQKWFTKIKCITTEHITPFKTIQQFLFCSFQKQHNYGHS